MAVITFDDARQMATDSEAWMQQMSAYITSPSNPAPTDIYGTQKLAFEIDINELKNITDNSERLVGVLGYESNGSLSLILVGTDKAYKPAATVEPIETFPILADMSQLPTVLNVYLKP